MKREVTLASPGVVHRTFSFVGHGEQTPAPPGIVDLTLALSDKGDTTPRTRVYVVSIEDPF